MRTRKHDRRPGGARNEVSTLNAERHAEEVRLGIAAGMRAAKKKAIAKMKSAKGQRGKAADEVI